MGKMRKRKGFTLIEVIVALGIFLILILALVGSYYSYYNSVKQMAYKAIGQNIAELQLEDVRYLPVGILYSLCGGGDTPPQPGDRQYPPSSSWQYYKPSSDSKYYEQFLTTKEEEEAAGIPDGIPFPTDGTWIALTDIDSDPTIYDSWKTDGAFRLQQIGSVLGVTNSVNFDPEGLLQQYLPANIKITPVYETDGSGNFTGYDYTIILNKEVFPYYHKKIEITDETPNITDIQNKIFKIEVTVYWTVGGHIDPSVPGQIVGGTTKHITITTEKSAG
jgi:prepilin-type N-terminal cleavage/methylation domain-containing protein